MKCFFRIKMSTGVWKNGCQWMRDQENIVDVSKSHIPIQWASVWLRCGQALSWSKTWSA